MTKDNLNWLDNNVMKSNSAAKCSQTKTSERSSLKTASGLSTAQRNSMDSNAMLDEQGPPPVTDKNYIVGYLSRNIGKNVRAEFVVGTNQFVDKTGILREVGVNYFVLEDYISHARIMCDLYSVKFVTTL